MICNPGGRGGRGENSSYIMQLENTWEDIHSQSALREGTSDALVNAAPSASHLACVSPPPLSACFELLGGAGQKRLACLSCSSWGDGPHSRAPPSYPFPSRRTGWLPLRLCVRPASLCAPAASSAWARGAWTAWACCTSWPPCPPTPSRCPSMRLWRSRGRPFRTWRLPRGWTWRDAWPQHECSCRAQWCDCRQGASTSPLQIRCVGVVCVFGGG